MSINNEVKKEILKDSLRNYERLEQLITINKDDIKSIHITLNVDNGDRLEMVNIKPMLVEPEITATYVAIKNISKTILTAMSEFLQD